MKGYKSIVRFSRVSIKESLCSVIFFVVLAVTFFVIQYLCSGVGLYLHTIEDRMNIFEIYIWFNSRRQSHVIYLMGLIFLVCGTNFFHTGSSYYLLRTTRRTWVFSQIIYLFVITGIYNLFILISFWISCRGALTLKGEWSEAAFTACQFWTEDIGIISFIMADAGFLKHNPNMVGVITFALQLLIGVIVGMILIAFQAKGKMVIGVMLIVVLWFIEVMFTEAIGIPVLAYMTPFRLSTPGQLGLNEGGPSVIYAFSYLILLFVVLETILVKLSKQIDFVKME